jgi:hypothetical protein
VVPGFVAVGVASAKFIPIAYRDLSIAFSCGFVAGTFLMLGVLYFSLQKAPPSDTP